MPTLETPPNPPVTPPEQPQPLKVSAGRFGELDHTELVHLLDSLDDDRSRSRFRESIYISIFIYIALAWFVFYGPRVLFHQGRIISPGDVLKQRDKELTYLDMPPDLSKLTPKNPKALSDKSSRAQTSHPTLDKKTLEQLQATRRAGSSKPPSPAPLPATPQPQASQPQASQPPAPQPQQRPPQPTTASIPDAPHPAQSTTRPNFGSPTTPGQSIRDAANAAAGDHGQAGQEGAGARVGHQGANTGLEVLSDTLGVDFGPYIKKLLRLIKAAWLPLIPEECYPPLNKTGMTLIRFTINPDGTLKIGGMHLDGSTHDVAIDKAAWASITSQGQFPPLPNDFKGPNLELRIQFNIIREGTSAQ